MGFFDSLRKFGGLLTGIAAGFLFSGAATFSALAFSIGSTIGGFLFRPKVKGTLEGAKVQTSAYGQFIPVVYGTFPQLAGNVIDCPEGGGLEEVPWKEGSVKRSFTGAILFCSGEMEDGCGERRIDKLTGNDIVMFDRAAGTNAEKFLFWRSDSSFTYDAATGTEHFSGGIDNKGFWGVSNEFYLYRGTRTQTPCPILEALHGGDAPGYHDDVYVAFNRLILKPWDEALPVIKAEIYNVTTGVRTICEGHIVRNNPDEDRFDLSVLDSTIQTSVSGAIQLQKEPPRALCDKLASWCFADLIECDGLIQADNV